MKRNTNMASLLMTFHTSKLQALILAVPHDTYLANDGEIARMLDRGGVLVDVKGALARVQIPDDIRHWSL